MDGRPRPTNAYLLELAAGTALLGAANVLLLPRDPGFLSIHPNPALFLVALIAARHGLREGVMAAVVTGGLVLASTLTRIEDLTPSALRSLGTYAMPLLLLATGFVLGGVRQVKLRETEQLRTRLQGLEQELADQAVRFLATIEVKHELEQRLADESQSLSHLYAAARAMETLEVERLYPAITATTRRFLQADACQLYLLEDDMLRLRAAEGAPPSKAELRPDEGLAGFAIRRGKPVSVRDFLRVSSLEDLHEATMLLAAPLSGKDGALLGCLTVTRLPFLKLTPVSLDRLGLVADWAARALENARSHEKTRARTIEEDEMVRVYTYAYYQRRLEEEQMRAERYRRPLSVLVLRIHNFALVPPEQWRKLGRVLALVFSRSLRYVDLLCRYATEDSLAIILPETAPRNAEAVASRLSSELAGFHFTPYVDAERELKFSVRVLAVHEEPGEGASDRLPSATPGPAQ